MNYSPPEVPEPDTDDVWKAVYKAARDAFDRHCHTAGGIDQHTADKLAEDVARYACEELADALDAAWEKYRD